MDHAVAGASEGAAVTQQPASLTEPSSDDASCVEQAAPQAEARGVVVVDIDVRIRPSERSPATGRLRAGHVVTVLRRSSGWTLIRYCRDRRGWVASQWLDHDGVQASHTEHETQQRAPQLVAQYRGEQYGVMGQSADGAAVRLLPPDDPSAEMVKAPIDGVALVAADLAPEDLPILIADETVVFPGGDFRAGQGRVLPPADEWMWLPWGWLLGHNDEHVWQWRPPTDELQLTPRPPGRAFLSLDGQHLAVARCAPESLDCYWMEDLTVVPLDGSPQISIRAVLKRLQPEPELPEHFYTPDRWESWRSSIAWSPDGSALLVVLAPFYTYHDSRPIPLLLRTDGRATLLPKLNPRENSDPWPIDCNPRGDGWWSVWSWPEDQTARYRVGCWTERGDVEDFALLFDSGGAFVRAERVSGWDQREQADAETVRSAAGGEALGEDFEVHWSSTRRHAVVAAKTASALWLYRASERELQPVNLPVGHLVELEDAGAHGFTSWAAHWHADSAVLVHQLVGYGYARAAVLVDVASAIARPFALAEAASWSCLPRGGWSPDGELVGAILGAGWPDGLASRAGGYSQIILRDASGQLAGAMLATGRHRPSKFYRGWLPDAQWSADGKWFAVGGIQPAWPCHHMHE